MDSPAPDADPFRGRREKVVAGTRASRGRRAPAVDYVFPCLYGNAAMSTSRWGAYATATAAEAARYGKPVYCFRYAWTPSTAR